jgi:hypothetical protein
MSVDHSRAQELISERMDGERLPSRLSDALQDHLSGCEVCRAFERGAYALRERVRFAVAPAVPDLVDEIVGRVERSRQRAGSRLRVVRPALEPRRPRRRLAGSLASVVAALLAGALAGSLVVGGPFRSPERQSAIAASDVTHGVAQAASRLTAYQARFHIIEQDFSPEVPVRELSMDVWFRTPERFRLDVTDHTAYPSPDVTPTDLQLVVNGSSWASRGPAPCQFARCPQREAVVRNRVPFSSTTPVPTDLVLPVTTLADVNDVRVIGTGIVLGREAVEIELPFERAAPLFPFLSLGGRWRPFYPKDRVELWLDRTSWFPLRWTVYPAGGHERDRWAMRFGLRDEPSRRPIFQVDALSLDTREPVPGTFRIPRAGRTRDAGATVTTLDGASDATGFQPVTPSEVAGLDLYRVVLPPAEEPPGTDQTVIAYSKGLSWLKLGETRAWTADALFGPVGFHAQQVELPGGGLAYYEPATEDQGRRLSIHGAGADLYLETNLSRGELLAVAGSLPLRGIPIPGSWRVRESPRGQTERVSLERAAAAVPFELQVPRALPAGYGFASAELVTLGNHVGVNLYYQQLDAELGVGPIRLHTEEATTLPPASSASQDSVHVWGVEGRWTPERHQLEWVKDGVYHSLDASGIGLPELLELAGSLGPIPAPSPGTTP